jgi:hypothetical protein
LIAKYGKDIVYADVQRLGFIASTRPTTEAFNEYLSAVFSPHESSGVARESLVFGAMVYPDPKGKDDGSVAKAKRFLKAMPGLVSTMAVGLEAICTGDFAEYEPTDEEREKLDKEFEFGWVGLVPSGCKPIILATDEIAGSVVRRAIEASQQGHDKLSDIIRAAVIACVKKPDVSTVESLLDERPGLLIPLWVKTRDVTGAGNAEVGKG